MRITLQQEEIMNILTDYIIKTCGVVDNESVRESGFFDAQAAGVEVEDLEEVIFSIQTPVIEE